MPLHVVIRLPDGRVACADYREPIAAVMRKVNVHLADFTPVPQQLYFEVGLWLDRHLEQSAACHAYLTPTGLPCGHD